MSEDDKKPTPNQSNESKGSNQNDGQYISPGTLIKGHIPDFKYTSQPPERPSDVTDTSDKSE